MYAIVFPKNKDLSMSLPIIPWKLKNGISLSDYALELEKKLTDFLKKVLPLHSRVSVELLDLK